jgi:hypothetical protein
MDIPPENPDYEWEPTDFHVPTGSGATEKPKA